MTWAYFGVGIAAAVLSLTALWPPKGPIGSAVSFLPSWLVSEAPLHLAAVVVAATLAFGLAGAFGGWQSWVGLALAGVACGGLAVQFASGLRSQRRFGSALAALERVDPEWRWTAQDTWRVVVLAPLEPKGVERIRDIQYVDDGTSAHRLDIYRRAGLGVASRAPVLLYFHGGAWTIGDKREQALPLLRHLADRGFVCVTANYALSPKAKWPQHVLDCKLALAWVKRNIANFGGDPSLVFLAGSSAGGHLAALVALTAHDPGWQPGFEEDDTSVVGCIPLYGVYDFVDKGKIGNPNIAPLLEKKVFERPDLEAYATASPMGRVGEETPPFLVVHGRSDVLVPVATARAFVAALREGSRQPVAYVELPLAQHAFDNFWSPRTVHLVHAAERFMTGMVSRLEAGETVGPAVGPRVVRAYHAANGGTNESRPARTDDEPGSRSSGDEPSLVVARDLLDGRRLSREQGS